MLESYVTKVHKEFTALTFLKKALKLLGGAEKIVAVPAALREIGNLERRDLDRWLRRRESLQKFDSSQQPFYNLVSSQRHLLSRKPHKGYARKPLPEFRPLENISH